MSGKYYDFQEIKREANGRWDHFFSKMGINTAPLSGKHTFCPGCGGTNRFRYDNKDGDGTWICSGGGNLQSGDGIGLIMHVKECTWQEAVQIAGEALGLNPKQGTRTHKPSLNQGVASKPDFKQDAINELYDHELLKKVTRGIEKVSPEWFIERSPVDPRKITSGEFINAIFEPGEKALIFTSFFSQGDFAWVSGKSGYRLGDHRSIAAVKSALPVDGGKEGVWFLSNPVTLKWELNTRKNGEYSRRTKECVSSWKYLVLECDEAKTLKKRAGLLKATQSNGLKAEAAEKLLQKLGKNWAKAMLACHEKCVFYANLYAQQAKEVPELWFKFLAVLPNPIRAIYSSGGDSWHALIYVGCKTWADMDGLLKGNPNARGDSERLGAKRAFSRFGADPGALTPVRLTRLPGCMRNGKEQKLIYLNDAPEAKILLGDKLVNKRILDLVPRRKVA